VIDCTNRIWLILPHFDDVLKVNHSWFKVDFSWRTKIAFVTHLVVHDKAKIYCFRLV